MLLAFPLCLSLRASKNFTLFVPKHRNGYLVVVFGIATVCRSLIQLKSPFSIKTDTGYVKGGRAKAHQRIRS